MLFKHKQGLTFTLIIHRSIHSDTTVNISVWLSTVLYTLRSHQRNNAFLSGIGMLLFKYYRENYRFCLAVIFTLSILYPL